MSTVRHPTGPQPAKTYWRRRIVVLLGVVAVITVIVLIIVRPGSGNSSGSSGSVNTPVVADLPSAPGAVNAAAPSDGTAACAAGNIAVTSMTDKTTYGSDEKPLLSFSIINTGADPCTINAGTSKQIYTITSGTEVYWVSTDCQTNPADTPAMLEPGKAVTATPFSWDRVRSSPDTCASTSLPSVPAGGASYHLKVSVDGITSKDSKQFILD